MGIVRVLQVLGIYCLVNFVSCASEEKRLAIQYYALDKCSLAAARYSLGKNSLSGLQMTEGQKRSFVLAYGCFGALAANNKKRIAIDTIVYKIALYLMDRSELVSIPFYSKQTLELCSGVTVARSQPSCLTPQKLSYVTAESDYNFGVYNPTTKLFHLAKHVEVHVLQRSYMADNDVWRNPATLTPLEMEQGCSFKECDGERCREIVSLVKDVAGSPQSVFRSFDASAKICQGPVPPGDPAGQIYRQLSRLAIVAGSPAKKKRKGYEG